MANELVQFEGGEYGMAMNLEEQTVSIVMLDNGDEIREGTRVKRTGGVVSVPVGEGMIGRIVNALGQPIDGKTRERIQAIGKPVDIKVLVSLSCTMCPDTVTAAQHIAAKNENVTAEIYDIQHFEELRRRYNVMSVPCILINNEGVYFGKKNIGQMLELIG
jgi:alkyl hydroperoxide reductase subunit AhpF